MLPLHCHCDESLLCEHRCHRGWVRTFQVTLRGSLVESSSSSLLVCWQHINELFCWLHLCRNHRGPDYFSHLIFKTDCVKISFLCHKNSREVEIILFCKRKIKRVLFFLTMFPVSSLPGTSQNESRHTVYKAKFVKPRISKFVFLASASWLL